MTHGAEIRKNDVPAALEETGCVGHNGALGDGQ
jgi:hypothetical protein